MYRFVHALNLLVKTGWMQPLVSLCRCNGSVTLIASLTGNSPGHAAFLLVPVLFMPWIIFRFKAPERSRRCA